MAAWGNMYLMLMLSSFRYAVDNHSSSRSNNGRGNISSMHALPCPSLSSHTVRLPACPFKCNTCRSAAFPTVISYSSYLRRIDSKTPRI